MTRRALDGSSSALVAVIQMLLSAEGLDDARAAIAHGARLIASYDTLSLYEVDEAGQLLLTLRHGDELGAGARALEELLCAKSVTTGRTVSTLDRFDDPEEQALADDLRRNGLCLGRPLYAYGSFGGVLILHFDGRAALPDTEFDAMRRFADCAAVALSNARTRAELRDFAYSDPLTGLPNRRRLEQEFSRLERSEASLLLVDFDGLKAVNDTLGFDRGDVLIQAVAAKLAASARPDELVVRLGGDEFVAILPGTDRSTALARAEELTRTLDELELPPDLAELFRGASVGAATTAPDGDLWEAMRHATAEMLSRKRRRKTDRGVRGDEEADVSLRFERDG